MFILKKFLRRFFRILAINSPVIASKVIYFRVFRKRLNLKNPTTFNEKLMWLKLHEDDALKTICADKYLVRDYVIYLGYSNILNSIYKVYENIEEIEWNELSDSFAMKCTHGSGFNIICPEKDELNQEKAILHLKEWMKTDYGLLRVEPHYSKIKPRIIVEKFLGDELNDKLPVDYRFHCFHGEPQIIEIVPDRGTPEQKHYMFNLKWESLPYYTCCLNVEKEIEKPEKINEMLEISRKLSNVFTYVRVDLYLYNNQIYFGELTFTPTACLDSYFINNADDQMGDLLDLSLLSNYTT